MSQPFAPGLGVSLARSHNVTAYQTNTNSNLVQLAFNTLSPVDGSQPHNNLQPYRTLHRLAGRVPAALVKRAFFS
jgi:microcystin-dependent protein